MNSHRPVLTLAALLLALPAVSQTSEPEPARPGLFVGAVVCGSSNCHGSVEPVESSPVRLDEYYLWSKDDPHADAYLVLESNDSALIVRNLGLSRPAYEEPRCLACHALAPAPAKQRDRGSWSVVDEGISCEGCHGPASGWIDRHAERSEGTEDGWSHRDSVRAGLIDLRDPVRRAETCLGCHLGDESRFVDHELLAAGHPVLRFELDNYSESPAVRHWKPLSAKEDASGWRQARGAPAWAAGQLLILRRALEMTASQARSGRWPEFIDLSCEACHHNLGASGEERWRRPEYRQASSYGPFAAPLGYPAWSPHRWALLRPVVAQLAPDQLEALEGGLIQLAERSTDFRSSPEEVAAAAEAARESLDGLLQKIRAHRWQPKTSQRLLKVITEVGAEDNYTTTDRASAQQAAWAVRTLLADLARRNPEVLQRSITSALEDLSDRAESPTFDATGIQEALERVGAGLE